MSRVRRDHPRCRMCKIDAILHSYLLLLRARGGRVGERRQAVVATDVAKSRSQTVAATVAATVARDSARTPADQVRQTAADDCRRRRQTEPDRYATQHPQYCMQRVLISK